MIPLSQLQEMFQNIRTTTPWNIDEPMLWGYFFTDPDPEKLKPAARELVGDGYRFVKAFRTEDGTTCVLHVGRVETHSPNSLFERNEQLYALATRLGLQSYDGMDVGPAPQ